MEVLNMKSHTLNKEVFMDKFEKLVQRMEAGEKITPEPGVVERISTFISELFDKWEALTKDEFLIQNSKTKENLEIRIWQISRSLNKLYIRILGEEDPKRQAKLIWAEDMVLDPDYHRLCDKLKRENERIERVLKLKREMNNDSAEQAA